MTSAEKFIAERGAEILEEGIANHKGQCAACFSPILKGTGFIRVKYFSLGAACWQKARLHRDGCTPAERAAFFSRSGYRLSA